MERETPPTDLPDRVERLIAAVNRDLADDRLALLRTESGAALTMAACALGQQCEILEELAVHCDAASGPGFTAVLLARLHVEATIVGFYLLAYGPDACAHLEGAFLRSARLIKQKTDEADNVKRQSRQAVIDRNAELERHNRGIEARRVRGDDSVEQLDLDEVPREISFDLDPGDFFDRFRGIAEGDQLSFEQLALAVDKRRNSLRLDPSELRGLHALPYRGLSTIGAHVNDLSLKSYMDTSRGFLRARTRSTLPRDGENYAHAAYVMTALFASRLVSARGLDATYYESVLESEQAEVDR